MAKPNEIGFTITNSTFVCTRISGLPPNPNWRNEPLIPLDFSFLETPMPKPKMHAKVHAALIRAGRPAHVAAHVAKKAAKKR